MQPIDHSNKNKFQRISTLLALLLIGIAVNAQRGEFSLFVIAGQSTQFTAKIPATLDDELINAGTLWILPIDFREIHIEEVVKVEKWLILRNFDSQSREHAVASLAKLGILNWYQYMQLPKDGGVHFLSLDDARMIREIELKWLRKPAPGCKMEAQWVNSPMYLYEVTLQTVR